VGKAFDPLQKIRIVRVLRLQKWILRISGESGLLKRPGKVPRRPFFKALSQGDYHRPVCREKAVFRGLKNEA
jgi:hypothetical protein